MDTTCSSLAQRWKHCLMRSSVQMSYFSSTHSSKTATSEFWLRFGGLGVTAASDHVLMKFLGAMAHAAEAEGNFRLEFRKRRGVGIVDVDVDEGGDVEIDEAIALARLVGAAK
jgi:hypothetical protein